MKATSAGLKVSPEDFKHITGDQVSFLAKKTNTTDNYVRKILNGKRPATSVIAKKVVIAANLINRAIDGAHKKCERDILIDLD